LYWSSGAGSRWVARGRRATTHGKRCDDLAREYPPVIVDRNPRYVRDGNCYTSAGVTAGIDLALALVELAWRPDHIRCDLTVDSLARRAAMSPRNFARLFRQDVGKTPARHIEDLRLEVARRQLELTALSLEEVADASGFASAETLRRMLGDARELHLVDAERLSDDVALSNLCSAIFLAGIAFWQKSWVCYLLMLYQQKSSSAKLKKWSEGFMDRARINRRDLLVGTTAAVARFSDSPWPLYHVSNTRRGKSFDGHFAKGESST
jgi:AraC-like DNA-binding protein